MAFPWLGSIALLLLWVCRTTSDEVTCQPEPIAHGRIVSPRNVYKDGDQIQFSCDSGYKELDRSEATCTRNGWNVRLECVEIVCLPLHIDNGDIRPKVSQYRYEETVEMLCNAGFQSSAPTSTCTYKGWQPHAMCLPKNCGYVRLQNGHFYYNEPPEYFPKRLGYATYYECGSGFLTPGKGSWQKITCTKSGWDPEPKCFKKCQHRETFRNGQFMYNIWTSPYIEGDTIRYSCDQGYRPANKTAIVTCTKDGWSPPPRCGTLEEIVCLPPHVENGDIRPKVAQYRYEETVEMLCNAGFQSSSPTSMCTDQGWQPPAMCIPLACRQPPVVENADIEVMRATYYPTHQKLHYQCHEGFEISGSDTISCRDGQWSTPPRCQDVRCPPPPAIPNGVINGHIKDKYMPLEKVSYRCHEPYSRFGASAAKCLKKEWIDVPECRAAGGRCDRPPAIDNGDILEMAKVDYMPGEKVHYKCQMFYRMEGNAEVTCYNGHWTEPPTCTVPCTSNEDDMKTNNIQLKWSLDAKLYTESGDTVEFVCRRGYDPHPASPRFRAQCVEGRIEYPRCIRQE